MHNQCMMYVPSIKSAEKDQIYISSVNLVVSASTSRHVDLGQTDGFSRKIVRFLLSSGCGKKEQISIG